MTSSSILDSLCLLDTLATDTDASSGARAIRPTRPDMAQLTFTSAPALAKLLHAIAALTHPL